MSRIHCLVVTLALLGASRAAWADGKEGSTFGKPERAPVDAVELTMATAYTQGFGRIDRGAPNNVNDIASGGIGFGLGVAYRISPKVGMGISGEYQEFSVPENATHATAARGLVGAIEVTYHFDPFVRFSPWVRGGSGYRMLWQHTDGPTTLFHGLDIVRLAAGFDLRTSSSVAFGPLVGMDFDVFLWRQTNDTANAAIEGPRVSTFFFGGVQGRFDLGGARVTEL
jgi:hypothetical protein